jgi:hypothetical protein
MSAPFEFEVNEHCAGFRPRGAVPVIGFIGVVADAIRAAREQGHARLLVDTSTLDFEFESPSIAERYDAATAWAEASAGRVRLALVLPRVMIDPHGFTPTSAGLAGLTYMPFETQAEALAWIRTQK